MPDVIGVQEPTPAQIDFLINKMKHLYDHYGISQHREDQEHSGIFVRKDKFIVKENGHIWINEGKIPYEKGYGTIKPRYFSYIVMEEVGR